jgi:general secretion pathway protein F
MGMAKFEFEAFDRNGTMLRGEIDSESLEAARNQIFALGATPFAVHALSRDASIAGTTRPQGGRRQVSEVGVATIARDLSVLLQAGVGLEAALRITSRTSADRRTKELADRLLDGVLAGAMLADVIASTPELSRHEYVKMVQAGELSGDLGGALRELADLLDRRIEIRARISAALTYPALLVGLAVVSVSVVLAFLLPAITPIFLDNNQPLPPVIAAMETIRLNWSWIAAVTGAITLVLAATFLLLRRSHVYRSKLDRLFLRIPVVGPISELREAARFVRTLATLLKAGVPMLQALAASCPLVRNQFVRDALDRVTVAVGEGDGLADAISRNAALPAIAIQLIAVGEESGRLPDMLLRIATIMERQEQDRTSRVIAILSPAVTIGVAGLMAAIILSVVSGILAINDLVLK